MESEEIIHFESTSLDYAQKLADIQEDLLGIEPDQIDDYVQDFLESPLMDKENRIIYLSKIFVQTAKNRPSNIENLALFTKKFVDKLFEKSDEKGNHFFTGLLSHIRNPFDLGDSGCFFFRQLINNEVLSIADIFSEVDLIEINQKIIDQISFGPDPRNYFRKKPKEIGEEEENYELYKVYGYIHDSSCLNADKVEVTEQILIKSGLMKWLADYIYDEFPGTVSQYLKTFQINFPFQLENYKKEADEGSNTDYLSVIIRNDDIESFKQIVVNTVKFDLNQTIKRYKFERNPELNGNKTLIEYAIYYNSMKIFRYLFLNIKKEKLLVNNPHIEQMAILGNNIECVRLLDQSNFITSNALFYAIKSFETDIFVWLYQNKYKNGYFKKKSNLNLTAEIFNDCIKYGNIPILLFLLVDEEFDVNFIDENQNSLLNLCAKYDQRLIARFLMLNDKLKVTIKNFLTCINTAIENNHPSILSTLLKAQKKKLLPFYNSIFDAIYKENATECFEAAIKIISTDHIRKMNNFYEFLGRNYTGEMIIRFLKENPKCDFFYNFYVLNELFLRKDYQTMLTIVNKAFHNHETQLKFSIDLNGNIDIKDVFLEALKGFDIPHYFIADKIQKSSFELVIGEMAGNVCVQIYNGLKPKFKLLNGKS